MRDESAKQAALAMTNLEVLNPVLEFFYSGRQRELTRTHVETLEHFSQRGFHEASLALGSLYEHGILLDQNIQSARGLYHTAWIQGSPVGAYNLGVLDQATGAVDKANQWFLIASDMGDSNAMVCLAENYVKNPNDAVLLKKAGQLFDEAVNSGNPEACYRLAKLGGNQNGLFESKYSTEELLESACSKGHGAACYELGRSMWNATDANIRSQARECFDRSAKLGDVLGMEVCIELFAFGHHFGLSRDVPKALAYLSHPAMSENPRVLYVLACLTAEGEYVPKDIIRAKELAKQSLQLGCEIAGELLKRLEE